MKQQIVIKLVTTDEKRSSKAMKKVVGVRGVSSASLTGEGRNLLVVIGEGVDSVQLIRLLRKKVGFAELLSVSPARENDFGRIDYGYDPYQKNGYEPYHKKNGYEAYAYSPYTRPEGWFHEGSMTPLPMTPQVYEIRHVQSPDSCSIM